MTVLLLGRETFAKQKKPPEQDKNDKGASEQTAYTLVSFLQKVVALADQVQQWETDIPDLAEVIQHRTHGNECRQSDITGKPNKAFS